MNQFLTILAFAVPGVLAVELLPWNYAAGVLLGEAICALYKISQ